MSVKVLFFDEGPFKDIVAQMTEAGRNFEAATVEHLAGFFQHRWAAANHGAVHCWIQWRQADIFK